MTSTTLPRSKLSEHLCGWQGGERSPLLLIHGVGLSADAWAQMIPFLAPNFSITAIDLPGHGESPSMSAAGLSDYAQIIAEILPNNCFVVGHSLGALLTMELTQYAPEKIAAIAPLNAIYQRSSAAIHAVQARAAELSDQKVSEPTSTLERWFGAAPEGMDKDMAETCRFMLETADPKAYKQAYTIFAGANGSNADILSKIACPAFFITGADEPNSTPNMSHALAKAVANGRAHIVPDAKHMMPMTHAELVSKQLIHFHQTEVLNHA